VIQATSPEATSGVAARVRALGGAVELIQGALVQAVLAPSAVYELADAPDVAFIRLPVRPRLQQATPQGVPPAAPRIGRCTARPWPR